MVTLYNRLAGQNKERLAALSDGVFAFAMTVLVLDLRLPEGLAVHSEADLARALWTLAPHFVTFVMSFMTLGIFWVGQQTQHDVLSHTDRSYSWVHIGFLLSISVLPFTTALLSDFITYRVALLVYWANILLTGLLLLGGWYRAKHFGLIRSDVPPDIDDAFVRRVVVAQSLYAFGAALCVFSNWWSIGFIFAVQINYVIAPRFWPLNRL